MTEGPSPRSSAVATSPAMPASHRLRAGRIADGAEEVAGDREVPVGPGHQALHAGGVEGRAHSRASQFLVSLSFSLAYRPSRMELLPSMVAMVNVG